jgi:hypothetical protein
MRQANDHMTIDQQVAFAWEHRAHFAEVAAHNLEMNRRRYKGDMTGSFRNAWAELAYLVPESDDVDRDLFGNPV